MSADPLPDRLQRLLGSEGLEAFDPDDALQVDRVAHRLLARFIQQDDYPAFDLLVDVCQAKLVVAAEAAAQEVGLAMPSDELLVAFFAALFTDLRPSTAEVRHPLGWASDWMREQADAWVRDLALLDTPRPGQRRLAAEPWADGSSTVPPNETPADFHAHVVKICFHRLDVESRRLLRAQDIQGLAVEEIAAQNGLAVDEVGRRLVEARERLQGAVAEVFKGADP